VRLVSIVGTRPQLIKAAALLPELRRRHDVLLVDTGQHWDERLAGAFFAELGLSRPDHALGVGGGSHAAQTGRMLAGLEPLLAAEHPDAAVVYGDTNSTLAGALAAAKLGIPIAHVEAGLRSFDRRMPEEVNRVVADHLSTWCFAPTPAAMTNLRHEGIVEGAVEVGDLMQDLASQVAAGIRSPAALGDAALALAEAGAADVAHALRPGEFIFATIHRAENREPAALASWPLILADAVRPDRPVILALHPGTRAALADAGIALPGEVRVVEPLGYRTSLTLQLHAAAVLTRAGSSARPPGWARPAWCFAPRRSGSRLWRSRGAGWSSWGSIVPRSQRRSTRSRRRRQPEPSRASELPVSICGQPVQPAGSPRPSRRPDDRRPPAGSADGLLTGIGAGLSRWPRGPR
jgi:UDP-N-acetylglucosamine 2-epimerase